MEYLYIAAALILLAVLTYYIARHYRREKITLTPEFQKILEILNNTNRNLFISGKAGTGKSTLLNYFKDNTNKRFAIVAPTGVAALNVKGQTIHKFFQFPPKLLESGDIKVSFHRNAIFKNLDMLIIDEVSMVRADLMNAIDVSLRKNRNVLDRPFGGVQMVFIGDLFQLPPVVTGQLVQYFAKNYGGEYFFNAPVFKTFEFSYVELTRIFRQTDESFKELLNRIRVNEQSFDDMVNLNGRHIENVVPPYPDSVVLSTVNSIVRQMNKEKLEKNPSKQFIYKAHLDGAIEKSYLQLLKKYDDGDITEEEFEKRLDNQFPTDVILKLKKNSQVVMVKNDPGNRWVNGSLGKIIKLSDADIVVKIEGKNYSVSRETWEQVDFQYDSKSNSVNSVTQGKFTQYPVKLAYAMTVHKSQGKTFDNIRIDIGSGAFAHGQVYVALSRCRTLNGILLDKEIQSQHIIVDERVIKFYEECHKKMVQLISVMK